MVDDVKKMSEKLSQVLLRFLICLSCVKLLSACKEEHVFCNINKRSADKKYGMFPLFSDEEDNTETSVSVCETEQVWFNSLPTHAYTKNGTWKELHARQSLLKTPFLVVICKHLEKPCFNFRDTFSKIQSTKCIQKYMELTIQLQVDNSTEVVKIPTACVCSVRYYYYPNNDYMAKYKQKFRDETSGGTRFY